MLILTNCERCVVDQEARLLSWRSASGFRPDVDHMEKEVQVSVQVEVEREEQGKGETHGKEQGEEQRVKERTTAQRG